MTSTAEKNEFLLLASLRSLLDLQACSTRNKAETVSVTTKERCISVILTRFYKILSKIFEVYGFRTASLSFVIFVTGEVSHKKY